MDSEMHQRGEVATIVSQVAAARTMLLGGRGTGVSRTEILQHTRGRAVLDGQPTPQHLATVARHTAIARGDAPAIALDLATHRQQLSDTVETLRTRAIFGDRSAQGAWPRRLRSLIGNAALSASAFALHRSTRRVLRRRP